MKKRLFAAAICLLVIFTTAGCGGLQPEEAAPQGEGPAGSSQAEKEDSPTQAVADAIAALKAVDTEAFNSLVQYTDSEIQLGGHTFQIKDNRLFPQDPQELDEGTRAVLQALTASLECQVTGLHEDGDTAKVTAEVTTLNLGAIVKDMVMKAITGQGDEIEKMKDPAYLAEYLTQQSSETIVRPISFSMKKVDGQWMLLLDGTVLDSMLGGLSTSIGQLLG